MVQHPLPWVAEIPAKQSEGMGVSISLVHLAMPGVPHDNSSTEEARCQQRVLQTSHARHLQINAYPNPIRYHGSSCNLRRFNMAGIVFCVFWTDDFERCF